MPRRHRRTSADGFALGLVAAIAGRLLANLLFGRVSASGDQKVPVNLHRIDRELRRRVAAGEYVVDPHAVAEAMIRRARIREAERFSRVLEAAKLNRLAGGVEQP
jgi:hypothetical protein